MRYIFFIVFVLVMTSTEATEPIRPLPQHPEIKEFKKTQLGFLLFNEKKLSANNQISCSTCHSLNRGGMDNLVFSVGINGSVGTINAPTVFNSSLNIAQFWNGAAKNVEDQIDFPLQHPLEMGSKWADVIAKLKNDPQYRIQFDSIFNDGISISNVKNAIATFERYLITPNAKFDRYLRGEVKLTDLEMQGYSRFKSLGCVACHQGQNIGGNMFETMGVMGNYFKDRKNMPVRNADLGRYLVTQRDQDKHVFRVPSLRNVDLTAPYFHDGYAKTLEDAVRMMAKYQLGQPLSQKDVEAIVAFLKTLTGESPAVLKKVDL